MVPELLTLFKGVLLIVSMAVIVRGSISSAFLRLLFSKWFFRIYFALSGAYLIAVPLMVSEATFRAVLFQTLGLMSGTDPFTFSLEIERHLSLWILAWLIHVASWLLIPALVAIVIGDVREDIKRGQALEKTVGQMLLELGRDPDDAKTLGKLIDQAVKKMKGEKP
jgi:hypothetical protein